MTQGRKSTLTIDMAVPQNAAVQVLPPLMETLTIVVFVATLMFGPLAFGATEPWSQFIQRTAALALFGLWIFRQHAQNAMEGPCNRLSFPALAFGGIVPIQLETGATAYRYATVSASLNLITYGIFILVAAELFARRRHLRSFVFAMAIYGFALAVFAVIQGFSGTDKIYWLREVNVLSAAIYGPYANKNHYAGLMEMLVPLAAAAAFLETGAKRVLLLFATAIMAMSIAFSMSRGGLIALAAELVFVCGVVSRFQRSRRGVVALIGLAATCAVLVLFLGTDKIFERISDTQDAYRFSIFRDSFTMALRKPLIGYGFGTFSDVYPAFRSFYGTTFVNHAHNDYLEVLVETGVVGLGCLLWLLAGSIRSGLKKALDRDDLDGRLLTLAVLTGIVGFSVHSLLDFNLQIPANAAIFFALCAAVATPFKHCVRPAEDESYNPSEGEREFAR